MTRPRSSRVLALFVVATAVWSMATITTAVPVHALEPTVVEIVKPNAGPRGGVALIGDSVMVGSTLESGGYGPSLEQQLADRGWGPIHAKAGVGFQTGRLNQSDLSRNFGYWLTQELLGGFDPAVVVVNLGANDILSCNGSPTCAVANIRYLLDVIGPKRQVWWSMITMTKQSDQDAWNAALRTVATQRSNLVVWDWPSVQVSSGIAISSDRIHLPTAAAYRARSVLMANDVTARLGRARQVGPAAALPAASSALDYLPVTPQRVVDTRETGTRLPPGGVLTVDVAAQIPAAATAAAVAVNATAADPAGAGYLTVWPCDRARPVASAVNYPAGQARGGFTTSVLSASHTVCVFSSAAADVIVDVQGLFIPNGGERFATSAPQRLIDTRVSGRTQELALHAPAGAQAVAVTLTVTGSSAAGFISAYPCGAARPNVSNVNWGAGETVAGAAFVPVGADGTFCVFSNTSTDVIVDLTGTFTMASGLRFVPVTPTRMVDTRSGAGGWLGMQGAGQTIDIVAAPASAAAVTGTITLVEPTTSSYLTGTVCGAPAGQTSSVNAAAGTVMANALTVALSAGGELCINAMAASHTLFDTTGWWVA